MATRLTTKSYQEIAGSTPVSVISVRIFPLLMIFFRKESWNKEFDAISGTLRLQSVVGEDGIVCLIELPLVIVFAQWRDYTMITRYLLGNSCEQPSFPDSFCRKTGDQFISICNTRCVEPVVLRLAELCKRMRMYTTVPTYILKDCLLESSIHFLLLLP